MEVGRCPPPAPGEGGGAITRAKSMSKKSPSPILWGDRQRGKSEREADGTRTDLMSGMETQVEPPLVRHDHARAAAEPEQAV